MEALRRYLNSLPLPEQEAYARRCGTTIGYLRKAISTKAKLGDGLVVELDRESGGAVRCEDLRPDIDWAYVRASAHRVGERKVSSRARAG